MKKKRKKKKKNTIIDFLSDLKPQMIRFFVFKRQKFKKN